MKRSLIFSVIMLFCLSVSTLAEQNYPSVDPLNGFDYTAYPGIIPDAAGKILIRESDGVVKEKYITGMDCTWVSPNWPNSISGSSIEGGIMVNMDADPEFEILYNIGYTIQAWNADGTNVPGWPQTCTYPPQGAPSFGDIDGDEEPEIVVSGIWTMTSGMIWAFELNGTSCPGFPINHGYASRTPVLADLDGNGTMEIITNKRMWPVGEVWVYSGDGTVYPGWPQPIETVPASSAAVGDITGDGVPEIVAESYEGLHVFDINGSELAGFPFMMPFGAVNSYSSPVLVDLDNDGLREIVFGTHVLSGAGYVFVLRNDGSNFPGWPQPTNWWIYGPPAVGFIDGDNVLDIAVGDQVLSPQPTNFIYGWNMSGNPLQGFPIGPIDAINTQVMLADLDGDGSTELMVDDNTTAGEYPGYNHDGSPLAGWPLRVTGTSFFNNPCVGDIDNDGFIEIIGAGKEGTTNPITHVYVWETDVINNMATTYTPNWQYNPTHDGIPNIELAAPPSVGVVMTPVGLPIQIPAGGGSFEFNIEVINNENFPVTLDVWTMATLPSGSVYGPIINANPTLAPNSSPDRDRTQTVPATAPAGNYTYDAYVGVYPSVIWAEDHFDFSKSAVGEGIVAKDWFNWGESFEDFKEESITSQPEEITLLTAYPNPFNPETKISFTLSKTQNITLIVYDIQGKEVRRMFEGYSSLGQHEFTFDGSMLSSGIYFVNLSSGEMNLTQKLLLIK